MKSKKKKSSREPKKTGRLRGRRKALKPKIKEALPPIQALRGMSDILPDEQGWWSFVLTKAEELARAYGFEKIDTPILEETALFKRSVGLTSDIVSKEMFTFVDQGGTKICLRPEITASVARAYIEKGMFTLSQPVNLYYFGPVFRHERPQAGRYRQFYQFGLEVIGSDIAGIDAQLILFSYVLLEGLGIKVDIQVNSLGCSICRKEYRRKLVEYFRGRRRLLCSDCQNRLKKNPLRILDCKEEKCQVLVARAPQLVDFLCEDCKNHFVKVLEYLDELAIPYTLNSKIVRGLDYYTRTVFEVWPRLSFPSRKLSEQVSEKEAEEIHQITEEERKIGSQSALAGGGRYDNLIANLGGRPAPAMGVAFGLERIIEEAKRQNAQIRQRIKPPQVFLAQLGLQARIQALKLFEDLRKSGIKIAASLAKDSLKAQMERANKLGVKLTLILGQKEVLDKTIIIRDMATGNQEIVNFDKILIELKKRL